MMIAACPCCKGTGWLSVHHHSGALMRHDLCTHCMGTGTIATELGESELPLRLPQPREAS